MRGTNTISLNGRPYDAISGKPIAADAPGQGRVMSDVGRRSPVPPAPHQKPAAIADRARHVATATDIHKPVQRSQTLRRTATKPPVKILKPTEPAQVKRSQMINRFAPAHGAQAQIAAPVDNDPVAPHRPHPLAERATRSAQQSAEELEKHKKIEALKGQELKEHLIKQRLEEASDKPQPENKQARRWTRVSSVTASLAALVLLGGYMTYLNLPSLSIRVAAAQAGVDAAYPSYQPAGYSFAGPVAFAPGEVRVNFESNTNDYDYSLVQRSSSWDSQAVLDNYVLAQTDQYVTLQEKGLTIYLLENKAAWVNGGVLYVIDGDAPLSSDQIQKIASSTI